MFDRMFAYSTPAYPGDLVHSLAVTTSVVLAVVVLVFGYNWLAFTASWHLYGYRPKFYDPNIMASVGGRFARRAVSAAMKICPHSVLSPEDREGASATYDRMFRAAFKQYVWEYYQWVLFGLVRNDEPRSVPAHVPGPDLPEPLPWGAGSDLESLCERGGLRVENRYGNAAEIHFPDGEGVRKVTITSSDDHNVAAFTVPSMAKLDPGMHDGLLRELLHRNDCKGVWAWYAETRDGVMTLVLSYVAFKAGVDWRCLRHVCESMVNEVKEVDEMLRARGLLAAA